MQFCLMYRHPTDIVNCNALIITRDVKSNVVSRHFWPRPRSIRPHPRPHEMLASFSQRSSSWPRCMSVIKITSFTLRSSLTGNCWLLYNILLKLTFEQCSDTVVTAILHMIYFGIEELINFMLERKRSYTVFL